MEGYNSTTQVRDVLQNARLESAKLQHEYVGTEHVLLSLLGASDGVAAAVFGSVGTDRAGIRQKIVETVKRGSARATDVNKLPYTTRAKKVLELATSEARELGHNFVGTEHLLLGLLREEKGIAAQVLTYEGLTLSTAREEVLRQLAASGQGQNAPPTTDTAVRFPGMGHGKPGVERLVKTFVFWLILLLIPIILIQFTGK